MKKQRVIILGSNGFVGGSLLTYLSKEFEIVPVKHSTVDLTKINTLYGNLMKDDVIINAAGYANATDFSESGKEKFKSINVEGVSNLVKVCSDIGVKQLIHISSVAAMGRLHRENITETDSVEVKSPYAMSKLQGEKILSDYMTKVPITIIRPTSVFGEGRGLAKMLCRIATLKLIPIPGGGKAKIPFTYIGNVCKGIELCVCNPKCYSKIFIVGDEQSYELREIIKVLALNLGNSKPVLVQINNSISKLGVDFIEKFYVMRNRIPVIDNGRYDTLTNTVSYSIKYFKDTTGYVPVYDINQALKKISEWYQQ